MKPSRLPAVLCAALMLSSPALLAAEKTAIDPKPADSSRSVGTTAKDAAITASVKTKLLADSEVAGTKVNVDTSNKVVSLSGTVSSEAESARAAELASQVSGVSAVSNNLTIAAPDETSSASEESAASAASAPSAASASSKTSAHASAHAKTSTPSDGSRSVGTATKDAAITTAVKTKLLADPDVSGLKINVDTRNKVVTLKGTVDSELQVARAAEVAGTVDGVANINNRLAVAK